MVMNQDDTIPTGDSEFLETWRRGQNLEHPGEHSQAIPCLTIIYHNHLERIGDRLIMSELPHGGLVKVGRTSPRFTSVKSAWSGHPIKDTCVSRSPFVLSMKNDHVRLDRADCRSDIEVDGHPLDQHVDLSPANLQEGVVLLLARRVVLLLHLYEPPNQSLSTPPSDSNWGIIGHNPGIQKLRQDLGNVAPYDVPVLLRGESGTGKELAAAAIHQLSPRRDLAFISVNMGALPPSLATTELFGAHRGAYTGATQSQEGYFRKAHQGTLFLDEIGDTPPEIQVALLRVLETKEVIALGAQKPYRVDTRIIAATDADLDAQMASGEFREQLMHRLAGYEIWLPPLRQRRDDIGHLLIYFLRQELEHMGGEHRLESNVEEWLPAKVVATLTAYHWPGNVRELKNIVKQLLIHNRRNEVIGLTESLLRRFSKARPSEEFPASDPPPRPKSSMTLHKPMEESEEEFAYRRPAKEFEEEFAPRKPREISEEEIAETYRAHRYVLVATAKALRISRGSLYNRIQSSPYLRLPSDLTSEEIQAAHITCEGNLEKMVDHLGVSKTALRRRLKELRLRSRPR